MEAVLWIARIGGQWSDLPAVFGNWNADVFKGFFDDLPDYPGREYTMVDATIVKVHGGGKGTRGDSEPSHRVPERRNDNEDSRAETCSGNLVHFRLMPGQRLDSVEMPP